MSAYEERKDADPMPADAQEALAYLRETGSVHRGSFTTDRDLSPARMRALDAINRGHRPRRNPIREFIETRREDAKDRWEQAKEHNDTTGRAEAVTQIAVYDDIIEFIEQKRTP